MKKINPQCAGAIFKHLAQRLRWKGGTLGLYGDYLKKSCHLELSSAIFRDSERCSLRHLFECDKCLELKKKKRKRGTCAKSVIGRCACRYRPAYFRLGNVKDIQKLSDLIGRPLVIVSKSGIIFDNRMLYWLMSGSDQERQPLGIKLYSTSGGCTSSYPPESWPGGDRIQCSPLGPDSSATLAIAQCLAGLSNWTESVGSVFLPGTDLEFRCQRGDDMDRLADALQAFADNLGNSDFPFSPEGREAINAVVDVALPAGRVGLVTRKRSIGNPRYQGWSLLAIYGKRDYRTSVCNGVGGEQHFSAASSVRWDKAEVIELVPGGAGILPRNMAAKIPALMSASERQAGGTSQHSAWKENLAKFRAQAAGVGGTCSKPRVKRPLMGLSPCNSCRLCSTELPHWSALTGRSEPVQALHKTPDTVIDLLQMMNMYGPDVEKRLQKCFHLSMVAMDVECTTEEAGQARQAPRRLDVVEQLATMSPDEYQTRSEPELLTMDAITSENRSLFHQRPVLVCSVDFMTDTNYNHLSSWAPEWGKIQESLKLAHGGETGTVFSERPERGVPTFFFVKEADEWGSVCKRYLRHELERHALAIEEKRKLLQPELDLLMNLKSHHMVYRLLHIPHLVRLREDEIHQDDDQEDIYRKHSAKVLASAKRGWRATVPGQLEKKLLEVINQRRIFAHNAAGYDNLVLCPKLCLAARDMTLKRGVHTYATPDWGPPNPACEHFDSVKQLGEPRAAYAPNSRVKIMVRRNGSRISTLRVAGSGLVWGDSAALLPPGDQPCHLRAHGRSARGQRGFSIFEAHELQLPPGGRSAF